MHPEKVWRLHRAISRCEVTDRVRKFQEPNDPNEPTGEWLTVSEVADWLKVSEHHVYKKIAKMPGCRPTNVGGSDQRPQYRFHRTQLIAALSAPRSR